MLTTDSMAFENGAPCAEMSKLRVAPHLGIAFALMGRRIHLDVIATDLGASSATSWNEIMRAAEAASQEALRAGGMLGLHDPLRLVVIGMDGDAPAGFYVDTEQGETAIPMESPGFIVCPMPSATLGDILTGCASSVLHAERLAKASIEAMVNEGLPCGGRALSAVVTSDGMNLRAIVTSIDAEADRAG